MPIAAERGTQKIAVEIKSFIGRSGVTELQHALGQYLLYRNVIADIEPEREVFLAIPDTAYDSFIAGVQGSRMVKREHIKLLVYEITEEVITQWIA